MAASATMQLQSILARPMASGSVHGARSVSQQISSSLPSLRRRASLRVQCMAEESKESIVEGQAAIPTPPPPKPKQVSTKFRDVLAFAGPAPERVNGRLAMVGFVAAVGVELANGNDLLAQISNGSGVAWFVGTSVVLTLASLVPLFQGVTVQSKSEGLMTSDAEMWNGRLAMLGLVALAFTEYVKGGALV